MVRGCLISWLWLFERNLVLLWNMIRFSYHRRTPTPNMATLILCCITLFYKDTLLLTQPVVISLFPSLCREGSTLWLHKLYIKLRIMEQVSLKQCHPHDVLETYFMWKFHRWELFFLFHQKVVHVLVLHASQVLFVRFLVVVQIFELIIDLKPPNPDNLNLLRHDALKTFHVTMQLLTI